MMADIPIEAFDALDHALDASGPAEALDHLARTLADRGEYRALLDALLLRARHDLGLPLVQDGPLADLAEPARTRFEERYVEALREVGGRILAAGEIAAAWPYFRAIAEKEPVVAAIEAYRPDDEDERLGPIVDVAFNQGAHPEKGFALILDHYGTCSAITAFDHLPPDEPIRAASADRLVRRLHADLVANLRAEVIRRGQPTPSEGASIPDLIAGRDWLFADDAYHVDVSHLGATVRLATLLLDPATIALAVELTEYGRRLSGRYDLQGDPPFDDTYPDLGAYLGALIGRDVEAAIARFRAKVEVDDPDGPDPAVAAQVLVRLLVRLGRMDEAIEVSEKFLAHLSDSALACPSVSQLCQQSGQPDRLARFARDRGDLVAYAAAILQRKRD